MADTSVGGSLMDISIAKAYKLYERIVETQSMWSTEREALKKTVGIHNKM